jgi:hypothetical protein
MQRHTNGSASAVFKVRSRFGGACAVLAGLVMVGIVGGPAGAQPLIDNIDVPVSATTIVGTAGDDRLWAAQSFNTPRCAVLNSIDLRLGLLVGEPQIVAQLRMGEGPNGVLIADLIVPALSAGATEIVTLTPATPVTLTPLSGQNVYWIVLGCADPAVPTGESFGWSYAESNDAMGDGALLNYHYSFDVDATWLNFGNISPYNVRLNVPVRCIGDFNCSGTATVQDIFDFLSAWFAGAPSADVNGASGVTVQDIFDFLTSWFAGCP